MLKKMTIFLLLLAAGLAGLFFWIGSANLPAEQWSSLEHLPSVAATEFRPGQELVVVSYNIGYFSGMTNNLPVARSRELYAANLARAVAALGPLRPDALALQEVDFAASRSFDQDQAVLLAQGLGLGWLTKAVGWDKKYVPYPYWPPQHHFGRVVSGQALLARYPLADLERHALAPRGDTPFYYNALYMDRLVQTAALELGGRRVWLACLHLEAWDRPTRERQARQAAAILARLRERGPLIVMGDFNTTPTWARVQTGFVDEPEQDFRGEATLAAMTALSLREAFDQGGSADEAATLTFPADRPSRKLDHIFYDPTRLELVWRRVVVEAGQASDHLPVAAAFRLKD
ncbi:Endonuclease/exonuclease/phosphatase [Desulfarculus baarsii DSM 2075]|uniref:Endonuclease/exonuclease/phosphatase n=1 Tax=Desulfarculus baarsii (strain ATCC 33931 / DSM 2075 / LMG 7858 / VKM B-1802 / 2st14) TaxID=644282 RepID=E1QDW6_DESB2|nr:endonuclease/exonuclease/phosphatase family protein [Desulfarculus baarsii]ADK83752.1 Endonuclease/exonuclease/phosphatase [Desulfarculus baarsii DSM 2075]